MFIVVGALVFEFVAPEEGSVASEVTGNQWPRARRVQAHEVGHAQAVKKIP